MRPDIEKLTTKDDLIAQGYTPLTKEALLALVSNNTVHGDYEYNGHRVYKTFMNANGEMDGRNDWGSNEAGKYTIDDDGYLSVTWQGYWEDWSGLAFKVDGAIKFYDAQSGRWRTTFTHILQGKQDLHV